jgi:hypothetical protein
MTVTPRTPSTAASIEWVWRSALRCAALAPTFARSRDRRSGRGADENARSIRRTLREVSRRPDPVGVYLAQRAGFERRLVEALGPTEDRARELLTAWETEAAQRGVLPLDDRYWPDAEAWVLERTRR